MSAMASLAKGADSSGVYGAFGVRAFHSCRPIQAGAMSEFFGDGSRFIGAADNGDQCGYPTDPPAAPPEVCGGTGSIVTPNGIMTAPKPAVAVNDDWNGATSGGTNESSVKPVTVFAGKSTGR